MYKTKKEEEEEIATTASASVTPGSNFIVNICVQVINYYLSNLLFKINIRVFNKYIILQCHWIRIVKIINNWMTNCIINIYWVCTKLYLSGLSY